MCPPTKGETASVFGVKSKNINTNESIREIAMFSINGKNILISGGSRGIGRGIAIGLAQQGAHLILAARDEITLSDTAEIIKDQGNKCTYVQMDITSTKSIERAVKLAQEKLQAPIDVLINNAGMSSENAKAEEVPESDWLKVIDANLNGYFRLGKAVAQGMIAKRGGKIINMSSILSVSATPLVSAYCVSKAGINQLTRVWAVEWARYNIQVNAVAPGYILTDINRERFENKDFQRKTLGRIPIKRLGEVNDLLGAFTFLASSASDYITGVVLPVDGGWGAG
jgi:NAD(P)-dependent dehydrogenase (short-subunit alcohol dehydrogenase family)